MKKFVPLILFICKSVYCIFFGDGFNGSSLDLTKWTVIGSGGNYSVGGG